MVKLQNFGTNHLKFLVKPLKVHTHISPILQHMRFMSAKLTYCVMRKFFNFFPLNSRNGFRRQEISKEPLESAEFLVNHFRLGHLSFITYLLLTMTIVAWEPII